MTGGDFLAVHYDSFKSAIANAFDKSDVKFSKVSDLSKDEFEKLLDLQSRLVSKPMIFNNMSVILNNLTV